MTVTGCSVGLLGDCVLRCCVVLNKRSLGSCGVWGTDCLTGNLGSRLVLPVRLATLCYFIANVYVTQPCETLQGPIHKHDLVELLNF